MDAERVTKVMCEFLRHHDIGCCMVMPIDRPDGLADEPAKYWSYQLPLYDMNGLDMFWVATGAVIDNEKVHGHAVVYYNNRLVHDVTPGGDGIIHPCNGYFFKRGVSDNWIRGRVDAVIEGWFS